MSDPVTPATPAAPGTAPGGADGPIIWDLPGVSTGAPVYQAPGGGAQEAATCVCSCARCGPMNLHDCGRYACTQQEAATPPLALAARMEADASDWDGQGRKHRDRQKFALAGQCDARASAIREWAGGITRELAPAWDALTARLAVQHEAMTQLRAGHAEALASLAAGNERLRALVAEILDELDQWELLVEDDRRAGWRQRARLEARDD